MQFTCAAAPAAAVIGPGRVGKAISRMYVPPVPLYGRHDVLPKHLQGPIWVCTTNNALDEVLVQVPQHQHQQLIFIQNGMLLPWLTYNGLQHNTQVQLYLSATASGAVIDGGRTAVCGPYSDHVVEVLQRGGVSCKALDSWHAYNDTMAVKLLWSSIFWLLSAGLGGLSVGSLVQQHKPDVEDLVRELLPIAQQYLQDCNSSTAAGSDQQQQQQQSYTRLTAQPPSGERANHALQEELLQHGHNGQPEALGSGGSCSSRSAAGDVCLQDEAAVSAVVDQLVEYSSAIAAAVPSVEMARKESAWRNGWFLSRQVTVKHAQWLRKAGCGDLLRQHAVGGTVH